MRFKPLRLALAAGTAIIAIAPAYAQDADTGSANDIVVTARRTEERLQDVPISITVFNQQQLANKNLVGATQLATYTPSLSANNNFGSDNTTFAIRGFAQDIGTQPSVGTYFGDVVTPRGASNGTPAGDGASVGDFFDLQNVQVLKGPQGTLFGRNTTGGAVLFVPQRPTDKTEGYLEGSYGNYNMKRVQAMINIPINDTFKIRAAFDHMDRNGYIHNLGAVGPKRFGDVDYYAGRVGIVANLTPTLENYLLVSYSQSENNGAINKLIAADPTEAFGGLASQQLAAQAADGRFYVTGTAVPIAGVKTKQWQVINNTTWQATDHLTVHNIASYAELKQFGTNQIFGNYFNIPSLTGGSYPINFQLAASPPGHSIADEATITEEFRLEGTSSRFNWQAGAYYELAQPLSEVGSQSPGFANCNDSATGHFGGTFSCTDPLGALTAALEGLPAGSTPVGNINYTVGKTLFHDVGLYAQGTYKLAEQLKVTGGIRYTWDHESIDTVQKVYLLDSPPAYGSPYSLCLQPTAVAPTCSTHFYTHSDAPTWLIDVDYTPMNDVLIYAKYARGYRAATIVPVIPIGGTAAAPDYSLNYVKQEKVDAYEVGLKSSFGGSLRGTFNVAGFYNKFDNQQLQVGFLPKSSLYPETAAPVNAGKSTIYGAEVEASLTPIRGLRFDASYTYLHTRIDKVLVLPSNDAYITQAAFVVGDPEILSPKHKLTAGATFTFPLDPSAGRLSIGGNVTYRSSMLSNYIDRGNTTSAALRNLSYLPSLTLVDANLNWNDVGGSPFDVGLFVTNLTKRKYYNYIPGLGSSQLGFEDAVLGEPRFFGGRIRYHFGN